MPYEKSNSAQKQPQQDSRLSNVANPSKHGLVSLSLQPEWDFRPNSDDLCYSSSSFRQNAAKSSTSSSSNPVSLNDDEITTIRNYLIKDSSQQDQGFFGKKDMTAGDHLQTIPIATISDKVDHYSSANVEGGGEDGAASATTEGGPAQTNASSRVIFLNRPQPEKHCSNKVSTGKYSVLSFFPTFLFEQFRRYSNIFFLFIALLQQIPDVSPTGRYTTLVPLVFILSVSALKEIVEDFKRHRADRETNHREVQVLRDERWQFVKWIDVVVGDIIKVNNNQFFPADLVLLASSEPEGICFIETSNLDGETNLKVRQALPATSKLTEVRDIATLSGNLECEPPNRHLYDFNGTLRLSGQQALPVGSDQVLLRGAMLRNTNWVFGLIVYTGHESKLMKNSTRAPLKRSSVDKMTNTQILMLFFMLIVLCLLSAVFNQLWTSMHFNKDWYISLEESGTRGFGYNLLTFIILYNNLIPISLQVSLEVVRYLQANFINMDLEMYHEATDTPAMARTSNLNEELGMVKYIFSDKTGTLTRNIMEFRKCTVAKIVYENGDPLLVEHYRGSNANATQIKEFMELLSVCHTVIPERVDDDGKELVYHAASPDERALVHGAKNFGWCFKTRTPTHVEVDILGQVQSFEILNVLEFTSQRKRMSVIVRDSQGVIKIFCKGADTVIYERLRQLTNQDCEEGHMRAETLKQLEAFATEGLRTLCCAYAVIPPEIYDSWRGTYHKASTAIQHRQSKLDDAADLIELNFELLGATAIEDKLQDQVPETIATLMKASIHLWVLTGDKQETAINIGYSSGLLTANMLLMTLNADSLDATRERMNQHLQCLGPESIGKDNDCALVIDGNTLKYALTCDCRRDLLDLCISCKVVICCRVSPMQKAEVVELVSTMTKSVTLAIGDGANDVAMIQKAHVGVGISGMEGLQAACASDYSIAQFRYLVRLLLVHGAWNYDRMCKLILYSFYKNISLYVIELWFAIYSGWSGQILFERWTIGLYNVLFTAAPPLALGLLDKVCSSEARMSNPVLYKASQTAQCFNKRVFWLWICNSLLHSVFLFWLPLLALRHGIAWLSGRDSGYLFLGNMVYTYVVVTVCIKAGLITSSWTWLTHLAIWGSIALWFIFVLIYSNIWPTIPIASVMVGQDRMLYSSSIFWFGLLVIPLAALLFDFGYHIIKSTLFKTKTDEIRENEIRQKITATQQMVPADSTTTLSETTRLLRNMRSAFSRKGAPPADLELSHGYAFSQEEGGAFSQSQMIRAYDTTRPKPDGM